MSNVKPVRKSGFKMFPINKSNSGYSYYNSSPILTWEFNENDSRLIQSSSLRFCGKFKIINPQLNNHLPANKFDVGDISTDIKSYEEVAYIDDRTSVNSIIENISVSNMNGSMLEQAKNYNRNMSSMISASTSYKSLCSSANMDLTSTCNNDVISRECASKIEFALPLSNGFFASNAQIDLTNGLQIKLNLASDSQVIYGLNGSDYVYQLDNVFLMGDYIELSGPIKGLDLAYSAYYNYQNVMNSGNDHQNLNINLAMVNAIYTNFIPSVWSNNFAYNSFSTCPILNKDSDYKEAKIKQYTLNRGAIRYPSNYEVNERKANDDGVFQSFRSRKYLNSIFPYYLNKNCLISPESEAVGTIVEARTNWLKTPQSTDQGLVPKWEKSNLGSWDRPLGDNKYEKAANVFGIGIALDQLAVGQSSNYANASYNYNIESELDNHPNNVFVYCLASTELAKDKSGRIIAVN